MNIKLFKEIIEENNIPDDCRMLSDSGWECGATDMDGIYYDAKQNEIIFTQGGSYEKRKYNKNPNGLKMLYCVDDE